MNRDKPHGLKLYVQRVFIMDEAEQFLPNYLRFMKGVVDSNDLPLNISRELLQRSAVVDALNKACVARSLNFIRKHCKRRRCQIPNILGSIWSSDERRAGRRYGE